MENQEEQQSKSLTKRQILEKERAEKKAIFLKELSFSPSVTRACDKAKIERTCSYLWRDKDPEFAAAWDQAVEKCRDRARDAFYERAVYGYEKPVVSMGKIVRDLEGNPIMERVFSDALAVKYASSQLPEYKDKLEVDVRAEILSVSMQAKENLLRSLSKVEVIEETNER